jgi:hypothetical protein
MENVAVTINGRGPDNPREVELSAGSTTRDVLQKLNLPDTYLLGNDGIGQSAGDEEFYDLVCDSAKLRCVPQASVGLPMISCRGRMMS